MGDYLVGLGNIMGDLFDLLGLMGNPYQRETLGQLGNLGGYGLGSQLQPLNYKHGPYLSQQQAYTNIQSLAGLQASIPEGYYWTNPYEPGSDPWEKKEWDIRFCSETKMNPPDFYIRLMEIL